MQLSAFGQKFAAASGISALMDDLGTALSEDPSLLFMGGGNPGRVEAMQSVFLDRLNTLLSDRDKRQQLFGVYQAPQGDRAFRNEMAAFLNRRYGWSLTAQHIAVANGSQSAFFILANLFAGLGASGDNGTLHLPISPEYVGYRDVGLSEPFFTAARPRIERRAKGFFKYHVDLDQSLPTSTRAVCLSRPSNPTGNVVTDAELGQLDALAIAADVPLIIDSAYGAPFPNLVYVDAQAHWNENTILMLSLSKLGLPGLRTGIVVARPDIAEAFARANTVLSLATGTLGPALIGGLLRNDEITDLCAQHLQPFYRQRRDLAVRTLRESLGELPVWIHEPEGAFFLWLWCENLPTDSATLYRRLKERGVVVLPGQDFFIGTGDDWGHRHECLRLSYAGDPATIAAGCVLVADELKRSYAMSGS